VEDEVHVRLPLTPTQENGFKVGVLAGEIEKAKI
jgi:hypothetical protein